MQSKDLVVAPGTLPPHERQKAIENYNKLQLQWSITKHPGRRAALAERLKQSWIKLGGPMPAEKEVGDE